MTPEQLKASILQYAIQGKLVEQRAEEGTGEELYHQIQEEKQRLIKEGKIKKEKPLPEITADEIPFDIPESWKWIKLGNVVTVLGGKRIPVGKKLTLEDTGYKYIRVSDMKNGTILQDNLMYVPKDIYPLISKYIIKKEDIYITVAGTIGAIGTIPEEIDGANLTENADRLVFTIIDKEWLVRCLQSNMVQSQITNSTTKVGQPKLAIKRIQEIHVPLPPIAEQKRIVAKIEELLPYVDRYAIAYEKLEQLNAKFPDDMRKSILQYAIQGKLVEQRIEEGTGEELYQKIQEEKQRLIKDGKIKKEKPLAEITDDEITFDIPVSWKWVRLGSVGYTNIGLTYSPKEQTKDGVIVLRSSNIQNGKMDYYDVVRVNIDIPSNKRCYIGDILICARNGSKRLVGKAAIVDRDGMSFGAFMAIFRSICNPYIIHVINSVYFRNTLLEETGTTTINQITQDMLRNALIPLPPLTEQKRIVEKIEELLPICDRLKNKGWSNIL